MVEEEAKEMVTLERSQRPMIDFDPDAIYAEYESRERRKRRAYRYEISRQANIFTTVFFGVGLLIFVIGLTTGLLSIPHAFLGWVATWLLAFVARACCVTSVEGGEIGELDDGSQVFIPGGNHR